MSQARILRKKEKGEELNQKRGTEKEEKRFPPKGSKFLAEPKSRSQRLCAFNPNNVIYNGEKEIKATDVSRVSAGVS